MAVMLLVMSPAIISPLVLAGCDVVSSRQIVEI